MGLTIIGPNMFAVETTDRVMWRLKIVSHTGEPVYAVYDGKSQGVRRGRRIDNTTRY